MYIHVCELFGKGSVDKNKNRVQERMKNMVQECKNARKETNHMTAKRLSVYVRPLLAYSGLTYTESTRMHLT